MLATTWVQIIKAILLLFGATFITIAVMWNTGFNFETLFQKAINVHPKSYSIMKPGGLISDPISAISLGSSVGFEYNDLNFFSLVYLSFPSISTHGNKCLSYK